MKLTVERDCLLIIPETPQDEAFINDTLRMDQPGALAEVVRLKPPTGQRPIHGLSPYTLRVLPSNGRKR